MLDRIEDLLILTTEALHETNSYPFLPEIIQTLRVMKNSPDLEPDRRRRIAGALGRLILESAEFGESELGGKLLELAQRYADEGSSGTVT